MNIFDGMESALMVGYLIAFRDIIMYTYTILWAEVLAGPSLGTDWIFRDPIIMLCISSMMLVELALFNIIWMKANWDVDLL